MAFLMVLVVREMRSAVEQRRVQSAEEDDGESSRPSKGSDIIGAYVKSFSCGDITTVNYLHKLRDTL